MSEFLHSTGDMGDFQSLLCDSLPGRVAAFKHPRESVHLTTYKPEIVSDTPYKLIASPTPKMVLGKQFSFPFGKLLLPSFRNSFVGGAQGPGRGETPRWVPMVYLHHTLRIQIRPT